MKLLFIFFTLTLLTTKAIASTHIAALYSPSVSWINQKADNESLKKSFIGDKGSISFGYALKKVELSLFAANSTHYFNFDNIDQISEDEEFGLGVASIVSPTYVVGLELSQVKRSVGSVGASAKATYDGYKADFFVRSKLKLFKKMHALCQLNHTVKSELEGGSQTLSISGTTLQLGVGYWF